jgi:hypothetical protein
MTRRAATPTRARSARIQGPADVAQLVERIHGKGGLQTSLIARWDAIFRSYVGVSGVGLLGQTGTNADKKYIEPTGKFAVLKYPPPARADVGNRTRDLILTMMRKVGLLGS